MHKEMSEYEGVFQKSSSCFYKCIKCGKNTATYEVWESSCGGYEDYKYTCQNPECKHVWWIDGIDS